MKTFWNRRFEELKGKHFMYKGEKHCFIEYTDNEETKTIIIRTNNEILPRLEYKDFDNFFREIQIIIEKPTDETDAGTLPALAEDTALLLPPELLPLLENHNNLSLRMAEKLDKIGDELLKPTSNDATRLKAEAMAKLSNASYNQHKQLWQMVKDLNNMRRQNEKINNKPKKKNDKQSDEDKE